MYPMSANTDKADRAGRVELRKWSIIAATLALDDKWFKVLRERVQLPNGQVIDDYFLWENGDSALLVPVTANGDFVLTQQYKHGSTSIVTEFPGGHLEPGETPAEAAHRELLE